MNRKFLPFDEHKIYCFLRRLGSSNHSIDLINLLTRESSVTFHRKWCENISTHKNTEYWYLLCNDGKLWQGKIASVKVDKLITEWPTSMKNDNC